MFWFHFLANKKRAQHRLQRTHSLRSVQAAAGPLPVSAASQRRFGQAMESCTSALPLSLAVGRASPKIQEAENMKLGTLIALLATILTSCALASTETPTPTVTSTPVPPTSTATLPVVFTMTPSPMPAQPTIAVITPDSAQMERWKEYQSALAKSFSFSQSELALCEWDILGQTNQEIYVWAVCEARGGSSVSAPAVIHLATDGSIQNVENPKHWSSDISKMFPTDIQQKFDYYHFGRANELLAHIAWRRMHPEELPLIVLSATPVP